MRNSLWCALLVLPACADSSAAHQAQRVESPWRAAADSVAHWLAMQVQSAPGGVRWPDDILAPAEAGVDLATGNAGPVAFLLAHATLTGDTSSALLARRGARAIAVRIPDSLPNDVFPPATSAYYGWPSAAWVLERAGGLLHEDDLTQAARRIADLVARGAERTSDSTVRWSPVFNDVLFGNAGTALFMSWAGDRFGDSTFRTLAHAGALDLLGRAQSTEAGYGWTFRNDRPIVLPNFSHGASGIASALLAIGRQSGDSRLDSAAVRAARALVAVADTTDGGYWLPYGWPNEEWNGTRDHGWAHGPAGAARLFMALHDVQPGMGWESWVDRAARGLTRHPEFLPGSATDSMPNDLRFGRAGVAWFLMDHGDTAAARQLAGALLAHATRGPDGLHWEGPRPAFMERGGEHAAFTGLFQGTSGYGLLMLRVGATRTAWQSTGMNRIVAPHAMADATIR